MARDSLKVGGRESGPPPNFANQTIWTRDNLDVLRGMNSASVDLIYLDPPFNSNTNYAAPIGSEAAGAAFKDTWSLSDVDVEWINLIEAKHPALYRVLLAALTDSDKSYLVYMAARLLEMKRILKPSGSIYLHCDPTMSHYLKLVMDAIYGRRRFRNELIWQYRRWPSKQKNFQRMHDVILRYAKGDDVVWNQLFDPLSETTLKRIKGGKKIVTFHDEETGKKRIRPTSERSKGVPMRDVWDIKQIVGPSRERVGYPTQKPLALLYRIIESSTNPGDVVLDPFCGCATACIAAEQKARQWIGIDISPKAAELVQSRMNAELGLFYRGAHRIDVPQRTDLGKLPPYNHPDNKRKLYGDQGGYCAGCNEHFAPRHFQIDHITPRAKGGTDHLDNLQLLCGHCNSVKGDRGMEYLRAKLQIAA